MNEGIVPDALNDLYRVLLFLPEQASTIARRIDELHYLQITVMFAVAAVIALAVLVFTVLYRRRGDAGATPRIVAPRWFEALLYSGLLGLFIAFWLLGFRQFVEMIVPPEDAVEVYVSGRQWVWQFAYADGPASVGVLYVPSGRPVRLYLTSRDVIHSFFVPAFRVKRDAVPGMYTVTWFEAREPGRYELLCAEMCGVGHSQMRGEVVVLDAEDFEAWLNRRAPAAPIDLDVAEPFLETPSGLGPQIRLAERGRAVAAAAGCLQCHSTDGSASIGPTWLNLYGARETMDDGERLLVNEAYITESIMDPQARIVAGYPPVMPSFIGVLSPPEIAAIIEFMKSLGAGPVPRPPGTLP